MKTKTDKNNKQNGLQQHTHKTESTAFVRLGSDVYLYK